MSKNLRTRSQADEDSWNGLFDTQAGLVVGVSSLLKKRADTVGQPHSAENYASHMPSLRAQEHRGSRHSDSSSVTWK